MSPKIAIFRAKQPTTRAFRPPPPDSASYSSGAENPRKSDHPSLPLLTNNTRI
ncbi:hypothetical protein C7212DRAFT_309430, partial [Tuber magnatum]